MNYHRIDERLVTGGHLVDDGLATLKAQGVQVVIDLRDDPPSGQKEKLAREGIEWINIPVVWRDPKTADFERFSEAMREHQDDHVLMSRPAVSQHLKVLREAGLVAVRRDAQRRIYRVEASGLREVDEWLEKVRRFWDGRLDDLERVLQEKN